MKKIMILLVSLTLMLSAQVPNTAQINFAEPEYDFGEVQEGTVLEHEFEFLNTGTDTLRIIRVQGG